MPGQTSNVNYTPDETAATHAIVPVGADGTISVFTSNSAHIVVDVMGYITDGSVPASNVGLFVPVTPDRYYDSRSAPNSIHAGGRPSRFNWPARRSPFRSVPRRSR